MKTLLSTIFVFFLFIAVWLLASVVTCFFMSKEEKPTLETLDTSIEEVYHVEYFLDKNLIIKADRAAIYPTKINLHGAVLINKEDRVKLKGDMVVIDKKTGNIQFPDGLIIEEMR